MLDIAEGNLTPIKKAKQDQNSREPSTETVLTFPNLPNIFAGDKIFLEAGMKNGDKLKRFVISYGGQVLDEHHFADANLIVRAANADKRKEAIRKFGVLAKRKAPEVSEKWLYDSIFKKTRQSEANYKP